MFTGSEPARAGEVEHEQTSGSEGVGAAGEQDPEGGGLVLAGRDIAKDLSDRDDCGAWRDRGVDK
jgi:hypothetical protein